jgi:LPXTG cell wall anchor motif
MIRSRSARWSAAAATVLLSLASTRAASAAALPPVDGFPIDASLVGLPTKCLNVTTGEWAVAWNFSVTSAINSFSLTAKSASAGGMILTSQAQKAIFPIAPSRTITFMGSATYFGKDAVTQTVTYDLLVSSAATKDGKVVVAPPLATMIASPCTTSSSIATTTTTISTTACSCTPVVTVKDPAATTTSTASTTSLALGTTTTVSVLPGAVSPSPNVAVLAVSALPTSTVAVLAVSAKPKVLPRTGSDVRSLLATAGAFVIVGITLAALPRRRSPGRVS